MFPIEPVETLKAASKWDSEMVKRTETRPERMDERPIFPPIETTSVDSTAPEVTRNEL